MKKAISILLILVMLVGLVVPAGAWEEDIDNLQGDANASIMRNISEETIEIMENAIQEQRELGNEDFFIEIYLPARLGDNGMSAMWLRWHGTGVRSDGATTIMIHGNNHRFDLFRVR